MIRRHHVRERLSHAHIQLSQIFHQKRMVASNRKDAPDTSVSDARNAQQRLTRRGIYIDREKLRMRFRPGGLWIFRQRKRGVCFRRKLANVESVESHEPVR